MNFETAAATSLVDLSQRERSDRVSDPGEGIRTNERPYPLTPTLSKSKSDISDFDYVGDPTRVNPSWRERGRSTAVATAAIPTNVQQTASRTEPRPVRFVIIALAVTFLTVFVVLPLVVVFAQAFSKGISSYFAALTDPEALSAIRLTLLVAAISVSLNLVFGVIAAWAITKFEFSGKTC